jgi:3-oxoacyl-[acyl-carrier protein] reductase
MTERLLVTGGASGIGRAVAAHGVKAGWDVIVIDKNPSEIGHWISADLSTTSGTAEALEQALADGPITRLVNNVGAVFPASLQEQTLDQVDLSMALNLKSAIQCAQAVLPGMQEAGFGRIVNMSSRASLGKELRTAYAAAKAGLIGLTRVWALELASSGITVNAIGPGPIATDLFLKANPPEAPLTQAIIDGIPVKRLGTPEDVSSAAGFFLNDSSGFVTGQVLYVCGGLTVGVSPI